MSAMATATARFNSTTDVGVGRIVRIGVACGDRRLQLIRPLYFIVFSPAG